MFKESDFSNEIYLKEIFNHLEIDIRETHLFNLNFTKKKKHLCFFHNLFFLYGFQSITTNNRRKNNKKVLLNGFP